MIYKAGKCKCCGKNYLIVEWMRPRLFSFCSEKHAALYIRDGFSPKFKIGA